MDQYRWAPPLPSNGRAGPRLTSTTPLPEGTQAKLEQYYLHVRPQGGLTRWNKLPRRLLRRAGLVARGEEPGSFEDYDLEAQARIFLANLYFKASANLVRQLYKPRACLKSTVQRWLDTADGIVLPHLLEEGTEYNIDLVNELTRFALENCANNYSQFIARLKKCKKLIRKSLALGEELPVMRDMGTYLKWYAYTRPKDESRHAQVLHCSLWCQTRATGLADAQMGENSLRKFYTSVTTPDRVENKVLDAVTPMIRDCTRLVMSMKGLHSKLSCGPKACMEKTQEKGGQTAQLCEIVRTKAVRYRYDPVDLSRTEDRRRIKSSQDVLDYCIQWVLENPALAKLVKPHAVLEPSKARIITITPFAVSRIQGVAAHLLSPCLRQRYQTRSGMTKDRHLWGFSKMLHPQDTVWAKAKGKHVLSTDLSEATDHHSRKFAKRIWREILWHLRKVEGAPLGFLALAAKLHTSSRYVLVQDEETGGYALDCILKTQIGIFMGDFLTKPILTFNQDICSRLAGLEVYSIVGDDETAFGEPEQLETYLGVSSELGNEISLEDTFISKMFMFYCEETMLVPRTTKDLVVVASKENRSKIGYIDTPRARLLLPVSVETLGFSNVSAGRYSLLGKETRWVHAIHKAVEPVFLRAQLLQHINVPTERDVICPFIPEEIGGDGSFHPDPEFLRKVIETKSRCPQEVYHRIGDLWKSRDGLRLIRSETLNQVVTKYKAWLPTERALRKYLPDYLVVDLDESNSSLRSLTVRGFLEPPQRTFLKMAKAAYYRAILRGVPFEDLPKLQVLESPKELGVRGGSPTYVPLTRFLEHWVNPGFSKSNQAEYMVRTQLVPKEDYLSLEWNFGLVIDSKSRTMAEFLELNSDSILDMHGETILDCLINRIDLSPALRDRLNLFVESDSIIKEEFLRNPPEEEKIVLVSRDLRLGADLVRLGEARFGREYQVFCLRPCFFLYGRMYEFDELSSAHIINDPGAEIFEDMTLFNEGQGPDWIEDPLEIRTTRYKGVWVVDRQYVKLPRGDVRMNVLLGEEQQRERERRRAELEAIPT